MIAMTTALSADTLLLPRAPAHPRPGPLELYCVGCAWLATDSDDDEDHGRNPGDDLCTILDRSLKIIEDEHACDQAEYVRGYSIF